ncbi:DUF3800 domain-containing protein [Acinetobacter junii]|jgi:hypothetical protein|uniref:DUF3800 domain-containing protein n=1 Tax=Acinetobacter TaxID=469 RepID=UPI002DB89B74|nr:DUF3800 domain-containing protein [Acinetobacter junii]MEB8382873.1 DUF3800 domain-containing protein [Acinetobacter junii]
MSKKFYIDESGNTGDLIVSNENNNFSSQEYFTLACIGLKNSEQQELKNFIDDLKVKYKIQTPELKFSKMKGIFGKKIGFVLELLKYIEESSNFIIEITDKKFIICTNIVNCLINPPYDQTDLTTHEMMEVHQNLSQWIYQNVTLDFLIKFTNISRNPSEVGLQELFKDLTLLVKSIDDQYSAEIYKKIEKSINLYKKFNLMKKLNKDTFTREPFTYFLPLPDISKKSQLIGILPYIGSFYNILGRLNKLYKRDLSKVVLIHDNQDHFDEILKSYHQSSIDNKSEDFATFDHADFNFLNTSSLEFNDDKDHIGLQVSDLFAGFVNRAIPYLINKESTLDNREKKILLRVLASLYKIQSINYVLPKKHNAELFKILDNEVKYLLIRSFMGFSIDDYDNQLLQIK